MSKVRKIQIVRITVDAAMTIVLLLLMGYSKIGEFTHEWLGIGMTVLFVIHHILNRKWIKSVCKGKYTPYRLFQTVTACLILLTMLCSAVSGAILSRYIFASLNLGGAYLARTVHMLCGYWNFVLLSLHLGIHWSMMVGMVSRNLPKNKPILKWIARGFSILIAGYGVYAFIFRKLPEYLSGVTQFIFFDEDEPIALFLLDYIAVMGLFVFVGHYFALLLKQIHKIKNKKTHKEDSFMQYATLNTGAKMPLEGFGVFQIPDATECERVVYDAIKTGYRLLDTAAAYMNEEALGKAVQRAIADGLVTREELFITTKVWVQDEKNEETAYEAVKTSLAKLGLPYVDLVLLHQALGDYFAAYRGITKAYKEGLIKAVGVSILPKSTHVERMAQNIDIWDFELTEDEMKTIGAKDLGHSEIIDHFNPQLVKALCSMNIHA